MTATGSSTDWTERYLAAVLGGIPEPKRADVERELRSSIADAVEERAGGGEDRQAAERAVLEGLGDPSQLAAGYTGRPSYLIGPELFPIYRHFIPRLIAAAAPIAAVVLAIVKVAAGGSFGDAIGAGINGAINVTIQIAFWGTVIFVVLERADSFREARDEIVSATGTWTLERLPKTSTGRVTMGEAVGEIVTALITVGGLIFLTQSTADIAGAGVPMLSSDFTGFWFPVFVVVLAGQAVLQVIGFVVRAVDRPAGASGTHCSSSPSPGRWSGWR